MKRLLSLVLALALVFSLCACGQETVKKDDQAKEVVIDDDHYPVVIENYNRDKEVISRTYEKAPEKVLCVYQNSIETMLALGLEDHILAAAGLDHAVKPELEEAFSKLNYLEEFAPDKETVLMMEPDMILSWYSYFGEKNLGDVDYWHERDIHTYISSNSGATDLRTLENEYNDILNLGKIFNVEDKVQAIVDEIKEEVAKVQDHTKESDETVKVMILEKLGDKIVVYGDTALGGDMVKSLGADLITVEGGSVGEEDIINLNPDVIFTVYMDRDEEDAPGDAVKVFTENEALGSVGAIAEGKVFPIALGEMYCSGIRTIDGIKIFAQGIYPELYE